MRIGLNLFFFFFSFNLFAQCDFKSHISKVYSLSGSITVALKELQLLNNPKLKGISVFNPIGKNQFKGAFLPGGVFLSHSSFNEFAGGVVFFDESRELAKTLMPLSSIQGVEFKTRGLEPLQVVDESIRILSPFLQNCEKEFTLFKSIAKAKAQKLLRKLPGQFAAVYFLGEYRKDRPPEMIIVNDGIVKWLVREKRLKTYPSNLAYINWSARIMNALPQNILKIGIKDSGNTLKKEVLKSSPTEMTLNYPGALVPGLTQIEAWIYLAEAP